MGDIMAPRSDSVEAASYAMGYNLGGRLARGLSARGCRLWLLRLAAAAAV